MEFHQNGNDERYFNCNEYFRKRNENSDCLLTNPRDESGTMGQARFYFQTLDTS